MSIHHSLHHRTIESYEGNEPYIFISYSHAYRALVRKITELLKSQGYRVSSDGGDGQINMSESYYKRVENCRVFLSLMSPRTAVSQRVRNEVRHVKKTSMVILLEKRPTVLDPEYSYYLAGATHINANSKFIKDYEKLAEHMVKKVIPHLPDDVKR